MASLLFRLHNSFEENGIILETVVFAQERLAKGSRYQWAYTGYNMPPASLQLTYGFWTKQATFMDSYNFQRQREMISSYLRADENMPWSDLTDLLYY